MLNEKDKAFECLAQTFKYDKPRANACCKIGDYFLLNNQLDTAIFWYKLALKCEDITHNGGFVEKVYYNYYPYLQLCLCYYNLGDIKKAYLYNEKASRFYNNEITKSNKTLLGKLI